MMKRAVDVAGGLEVLKQGAKRRASGDLEARPTKHASPEVRPRGNMRITMGTARGFYGGGRREVAWP